MEKATQKTLRDLPQLAVHVVRSGATDESGYQAFEMEASFDPILAPRFGQMMEGIGVLWFWLLIGERDCVCPMLKSFDKQAGTAVLICHEKETPKVIGEHLAYLSPYWQAFHVWMVLDPNWGWQKATFLGIDAVAEDYEAQQASLVDGREVKIWTKLEPSGLHTGQSRHYPASDQTFPVNLVTRLIPGGWGHEHCSLCNIHIDAGTIGYRDSDERWMCENCYERYVMRHDLAFIDEL